MKFRSPSPLAAAFALLTFTVLIGLGTWQVQCLRAEKRDLSKITSQMEKPAVPMPEKIDAPDKWEYRRVSLAGRFLYDNEFLVGPRVLDGVSGYHMLVPFQRASGGIVFVDRGWISDDRIPEAVRPKGIVRIEGIVQKEHPRRFTPLNNAQKNLWYWTDISAMATNSKLKNVMPVIVSTVKRELGVYPSGGRVEVVSGRGHVGYAIFWYAMAVLLQGVFFMKHRQPAGKK